MSQEPIEAGKQWAIEVAQAMATAKGITLDECRWGQGAGDFDNDRCTLALKTRGVRKLITIDADCIEDSGAGDERERKYVEVLLDRAFRRMLAGSNY